MVTTVNKTLSKSQQIGCKYLFAMLKQAQEVATEEFGTILADAGITNVDPGFVRYQDGVVSYEVEDGKPAPAPSDVPPMSLPPQSD